MATSGIKSAVEVCGQTDNSLAGCGAFSTNGIPAAPAATNKVASVVLQNAAAGAIEIVATATANDGLNGETYQLDGTYVVGGAGGVTWAINAASTCLAVGYCK